MEKLFSAETYSRLQHLCTCEPPRIGEYYTVHVVDHPNLECEYVACLKVLDALRVSILTLRPEQQQTALKRLRKILDQLMKEDK